MPPKNETDLFGAVRISLDNKEISPSNPFGFGVKKEKEPIYVADRLSIEFECKQNEDVINALLEMCDNSGEYTCTELSDEIAMFTRKDKKKTIQAVLDQDYKGEHKVKIGDKIIVK